MAEAPAAQCASTALQRWSETFDHSLRRYLERPREVPAELLEAMTHSLLAPGKRVRPYLVECCYRLAGGRDAIEELWLAAECLHVFTLIHDDLPAMDNADLRRGRPSSHRAFGEALAILAGDTLLACGLQLCTEGRRAPATSLKIFGEFVDAIGWTGVIGGQVEDILGEGKPPDAELTRRIHRRKTARLFEACCRVGAVAAEAPAQVIEDVARYGLHLGLAFQIADDLLDVTASTEALGKTSGSDRSRGKQSFPEVLGPRESRRHGEQEVARAVQALESYGPEADPLRRLAHFVWDRAR